VVETDARVGLRTREEQVTLPGRRLRSLGSGDAAGDVEDALAVGEDGELGTVVEARVEVRVEQVADALGTARVERTS
jgi:hypothetical protein